jgi:lipopolysaccharide export LptBFGC system permease protein LptF
MRGAGKPVVVRQDGISLTGLIVVLALIGLVGVLAMKILPTYSEYRSVSAAIVKAKAAGGTPQEIRASFDRSAEVNYISSISGRDLTIERVNGETEVSFAYDKKIHLAGPASVLLEYSGSTAKGGTTAARAE